MDRKEQHLNNFLTGAEQAYSERTGKNLYLDEKLVEIVKQEAEVYWDGTNIAIQQAQMMGRIAMDNILV